MDSKYEVNFDNSINPKEYRERFISHRQVLVLINGIFIPRLKKRAPIIVTVFYICGTASVASLKVLKIRKTARTPLTAISFFPSGFVSLSTEKLFISIKPFISPERENSKHALNRAATHSSYHIVGDRNLLVDLSYHFKFIILSVQHFTTFKDQLCNYLI